MYRNACHVHIMDKVCEYAHRPLVACMARVEPLEVCISLVVTYAEVLQGTRDWSIPLEG